MGAFARLLLAARLTLSSPWRAGGVVILTVRGPPGGEVAFQREQLHLVRARRPEESAAGDERVQLEVQRFGDHPQVV